VRSSFALRVGAVVGEKSPILSGSLSEFSGGARGVAVATDTLGCFEDHNTLVEPLSIFCCLFSVEYCFYFVEIGIILPILHHFKVGGAKTRFGPRASFSRFCCFVFLLTFHDYIKKLKIKYAFLCNFM
jgi:hypothetical protein